MNYRRALGWLLLGCAAAACQNSSAAPTAVSGGPAASATPTRAPAGRIAAVDLLGAWVNAGASESEPFEFTGQDGRAYAATFADDVWPLFDRPNRWFDGAKACGDCHTADLNDSDAELDLASYAGLRAGSYRLSNPPGTPIILPGDWAASPLRARLTLNRMPTGVPGDAERDGPEVEAGGGRVMAVSLIGAWVDAGASATEPFSFLGLDGAAHSTTYAEGIAPLFGERGLWAEGSKSCQQCHGPIILLPDAGLDLTSVEGVLAGSRRLSNPPGTPIVLPGNWEHSPLRARLRDNRMPSGMPHEVPPEGPIVTAGQRK